MPSGNNINQSCGSTHPASLQKWVLQTHADIGFAFDGDGDRVIAVTKDGTICTGITCSLFYILILVSPIIKQWSAL